MADDEVALSAEHWFSKPDSEVLFYRVNRRPIGGDPSLFSPPEDLLGELQRVLEPAEPAYSGRKHKRTWRLGNLVFDSASGTFTGQLGWARSGAVLGQIWDDEKHAWEDRILPKEDSAVAPVAFTTNGRILGVLKHASFTTETVLDDVLSAILNRGEATAGFPTTAWSVEPLGDEGDFYSWLSSVDQLLLLRMVFERPNPDGEPEFDELFRRLDHFYADRIKEEIVARDKNVGLNKEAVHGDRTTRGFLVAALDFAFGRVWAKGRRGGRDVHYDQREQVQRQSLDLVGSDLETATRRILDAVEDRGRKQVSRGEAQARGRLLGGGGPSTGS